MMNSGAQGKTQEETEEVSLFPLLTVNFIGTFGFSIVIPFLVFLVERLGGNAFVYGLISSMYPAFQLIGAPVLGRWSDLYGRKKVLFLSQLGTFFSWLVFLLALYLPVYPLFNVESGILGTFVLTLPLLVLFFARAFDGLTGGNVAVANAYLADITEEKDRNKNFGKMSISTNLGFIAGPALAGLLSLTRYGEVLPVLGAAVISLAGVILIAAYVPESRECSLSEPLESKKVRKIFRYQVGERGTARKARKPSFKKVLMLPHILYMLCLYFLIFLGFNIFYTAFPLHAIKALEWGIAEMGLYFTVLSSLLVIVQGPVLSRAAKRYSEAYLMVIGSLMLGTNFLLLASGNLFLTYLSVFFFATGDGLMWPSFLALLSKLTGKTYQGTVQGLASSIGGLASITGLILGGFLYELVGGQTFLIAALVIYSVFLLAFQLLDLKMKNSEIG